MYSLIKSVTKMGLMLLLGICLSQAVYSQTPADDPGIGGPGVGAAPAGDGSPIVPFNGNMTLLFFAVGVSVLSSKLKSQKQLTSEY